MFKKIYIVYNYQKALLKVGQEEYFTAWELLQKIPDKWTAPFFYYMLKGYVLEQLDKFNDSLVQYDIAKGIVEHSSKLNKDEKEYLLAYLDFSYGDIYREKNDITSSKNFLLLAKKRVFDKNNIQSYILSDFPLTET